MSELVFSTPVEVFLQLPCLSFGPLGLLHARGGVSVLRIAGGGAHQSSPRPYPSHSNPIPFHTLIPQPSHPLFLTRTRYKLLKPSI